MIEAAYRWRRTDAASNTPPQSAAVARRLRNSQLRSLLRGLMEFLGNRTKVLPIFMMNRVHSNE